jgi:hypothetical protein
MIDIVVADPHAREREALLSTRPDLSPELRAVLERADIPLDLVRAAISFEKRPEIETNVRLH